MATHPEQAKSVHGTPRLSRFRELQLFARSPTLKPDRIGVEHFASLYVSLVTALLSGDRKLANSVKAVVSAKPKSYGRRITH
jgi:hypothetical protein